LELGFFVISLTLFGFRGPSDLAAIWRAAAGPLALTLMIFGAAPAPGLAAPPGPMPFGVYDPGGDFQNDPEVAIEHLFLPWEDIYLPSLSDADAYAVERNRAVLVTLEPWTWTVSERNSPQALQLGIGEGAYDANITSICGMLGRFVSPVTLRWGHEMDDDNGQFLWAGWDPDTYISAFRRVIDICRISAPNINVMWSPLGEEGMERYYPGDSYVDLVGVSVFGLQAFDQLNFGQDRSFTEIFAPRYIRAARFGKPVVVAELAYSGDADYVDAWEREVRKLRPEYPGLVGVVYFNQKEVYPWPDDLGYPDWRVEFRVTE
jgi:endoglucanase